MISSHATFRASSTLGTAFGTADLCAICLIIALALLRLYPNRRRPLLAASALYLAGCLASGEFSAMIGLVVILIAFGSLFGSTLRQLSPIFAGLGLLLPIPLWPVLAKRLSGFNDPRGMPQSWHGRLDNLERFVLPKLFDGANWLLGVQPAARVSAPERWREFVYIESGYLALLWVGGIPLMLAFVYFVITALAMLRPIAKRSGDAIGVAATAGYCFIFTLIVLSVFDPHLTLRGTSDLLFPLLAMATLRQPATRPLVPALGLAGTSVGTASMMGGMRADIR